MCVCVCVYIYIWVNSNPSPKQKRKRTLFSSRGPFKEKNLSIPAAVGSSPSMPRLVFWPLLAPRRRHCFSALRTAVVV